MFIIPYETRQFPGKKVPGPTWYSSLSSCCCGSSKLRAMPAAVGGFALRTALGLSGELCPDTRGDKYRHSFASQIYTPDPGAKTTHLT